MHRNGERDTTGRRWVPAPAGTGTGTTGSILGVWLNPGEKVNWTWSADGSMVVGYTISNPSLKQKPIRSASFGLPWDVEK